MKTAEDFKNVAQAIDTLAAAIKPADDDVAAQERKMIQYHLRAAAARTWQIAEALERKQGSA